jgi:hypothetical protein
MLAFNTDILDISVCSAGSLSKIFPLYEILWDGMRE